MIKNRRDFLAGLLFLVVGAAFAWAASLHELGSAQDWGAGAFPLVLAILLCVAGGWLVFKALTLEVEGGGRLDAAGWRPLLPVLVFLLLLGAAVGWLPVA